MPACRLRSQALFNPHFHDGPSRRQRLSVANIFVKATNRRRDLSAALNVQFRFVDDPADPEYG